MRKVSLGDTVAAMVAIGVASAMSQHHAKCVVPLDPLHRVRCATQPDSVLLVSTCIRCTGFMHALPFRAC